MDVLINQKYLGENLLEIKINLDKDLTVLSSKQIEEFLDSARRMIYEHLSESYLNKIKIENQL